MSQTRSNLRSGPVHQRNEIELDRRLDPEIDQNPIYTPKREGKRPQPVHTCMGLPCPSKLKQT